MPSRSYGSVDESQEQSMKKTLRVLGTASLLVTGVAATAVAAGSGGPPSSQSVTGTQLGSPQESSPATGSSGATTNGTYGMNNPGADRYPGGLGPTGSRQPDATNPARSSPSGGGGMDGGGGS